MYLNDIILSIPNGVNPEMGISPGAERIKVNAAIRTQAIALNL